MSSTPCYVYFEENMTFVSVQSKVILCLQGLLQAFDHMKALRVDAQKMKRFSIFMKLENIYPTVDWVNVENKFLKDHYFCSGGDFTYEEYLKGVVTIFREISSLFLNFWEGFLPGDEELKIWEDGIQSWLKKSEFYFKTAGKLFDGIVTEPIAFSYSLATASAFRAYRDSSLFFKDMVKIVERRVDYIIDVEPYHIDETLLKFAADAELIFSTGYEVVDMFGDTQAPSGFPDSD